MSRVPCSDEFFIKRLISTTTKKKKKKRNEKKTERKKKRKDLITFISKVYVLINSFIFFFMIHEATQYIHNTRTIRCRSVC